MHRHRAVYSTRVEEQRGAAARSHTYTRVCRMGPGSPTMMPHLRHARRGETRWRRRITSRPTPVASVMHPIEYSTGDGSGAPAMVPRHANTIHGPYDEQPAPRICAGSALNGQGWMGCYRRCSKAFRIQRRRRRRGGNNESSRITRLLVCSARVNIRFTHACILLPLCLSWFLTPCYPDAFHF